MHTYPKRACLEGLEVKIFKLVSYSATPEQWKEWLRVPLEHAAARGNLDLFDKLLEAGADGSAGWRGCRGRTLLDAAAVGGNEDVVLGLLRAGAQPDVKVVSCASKRSALYTATMLGHEAVARRLLVAGADVNFQDPITRLSILHEAARGGDEQLVTYLLLTGADPNCRDGNYGSCPLHCAAYEGYDGIVSTLLLRGADKDAVSHAGLTGTPLMKASIGGRLSVVKTLLAAGADGDVRGSGSYSALDLAASDGHGDVIQAIVGHGADVNARDDDGYTALHVAAQFDQAAAVDALVEAGADIELRTDAGCTPLAIAAHFSKCRALLMLLQHGAKVDVRDYVGETPLHLACRNREEGLEATVDLLLRWGADETALNMAGRRPAEWLDVEREGISNPATQDEIERARILLSRAPADRAWRRRGWLVMLRSRSEEARVASSCSSDSGVQRDGLGVRRGGGGRKARGEQPEGGADHVARRMTNTDIGASWCDSEGGVLSGVVAVLAGMEPEGVFRTIVGYL